MQNAHDLQHYRIHIKADGIAYTTLTRGFRELQESQSLRKPRILKSE